MRDPGASSRCTKATPAWYLPQPVMSAASEESVVFPAAATDLDASDRLVFAVAAVVGAVSVVTLKDGHNWGDDFAQYLLFARTYASGHLEHPGLATTPPLFSLVLAP